MKIAEIIERLEMATGPDRDLEWHIARAINYPEVWPDIAMWPPFTKGSKFDKCILNYTSSIDAAVSLSERLLPGWANSSIAPLKGGYEAYVWGAPEFSKTYSGTNVKSSRAIALCIATLRAYEAVKGETHADP